ncbi:MAG: hypothetical protein ACM3ML_38140 [Micromonosporaceae bacterium]
MRERQIWQSVSNLCRTGLLREYGRDSRLGRYPGAAALIPGVTVVQDATNTIGRHGVAVARTDGTGARSEWIFDRSTLQMIGEREVSLPSGNVTGTTAIQRRAIADRLGQLPPGSGSAASG